MATEPTGWNIVIVGAWNPAILTPDGIRKRLFQLPDGTPVNVEVAIDRIVPHRVRHDGVIVAPSPHMLDLSVECNDASTMARASLVGRRALEVLPETPLSAAGVNFRYRLSDLPSELLDFTRMALDDALSDGGYEICGQTVIRSLVISPGVVNVELSQGQASDATASFNFHLDSHEPVALQRWIERTDEFCRTSLALLSLMKLPAPQGEQEDE